ncbi:Protein of unknown function [Oryzisolibacter propanilivorax]|uniref:Twin transmembrane helix small protein n=1 Tax=Oryzisolibacter propanilivorax TaxID=1527607 RepID=A0A1G9RKB4_9BURK|nr:twin transmembrane helix small protein [Oryzisolibacter propanilivorax]SDM23668.1 Protein of unknown function [Oryzisolibacter propanilivorax]
MTLLVALAFLAILASLGAALFFMLRGSRPGEDDRQRSARMAWALALRVALSVALFLCLLLAWKLGYIQPTGLPASNR